jgi:hypothetical protein
MGKPPIPADDFVYENGKKFDYSGYLARCVFNKSKKIPQMYLKFPCPRNWGFKILTMKKLFVDLLYLFKLPNIKDTELLCAMVDAKLQALPIPPVYDVMWLKKYPEPCYTRKNVVRNGITWDPAQFNLDMRKIKTEDPQQAKDSLKLLYSENLIDNLQPLSNRPYNTSIELPIICFIEKEHLESRAPIFHSAFGTTKLTISISKLDKSLYPDSWVSQKIAEIDKIKEQQRLIEKEANKL